MTDLAELAGRVEAAVGADRELDALIWLAVVPGATRKESRYIHKASGKECVIDETRENGRLIIVPAYTGLLDAAMTLVPEGRDWMLDNFDGEPGRRCSASVFNASGQEYADYEAFAATPSLAITAAALRARAAQQTEGAK